MLLAMTRHRGKDDGATGADRRRDLVAAEIETIFRMERVRLIAGLARHVGDISLAEELAQEALLAALSTWPDAGVPANPGAWLVTTAKRRAIDLWRRRRMTARHEKAVALDMHGKAEDPVASIEARLDDRIGDDRMSLIFTACHPVLTRDQRTALTLKIIAGLSAPEIARAFLTRESTVAQRIVRAKKILRDAGIAYEVPEGAARGTRLESVLEVIYLIFNEGYAASRGEDLIRPQLCQEAMRLGRILTGLMPLEPEAHGLLALMELQASRLSARIDANGDAVTLDKQNRAQWDRLLIQRGFAGLARSRDLGGADGIHALQAALAAVHARAPRFADTDWKESARLYDRLLERAPSPIIALNRAVAHSMADGPDAGLSLLDAIADEPVLQAFPPYHAARGDMLDRLGRRTEAGLAFEAAARLSGNAVEQRFLLGRAAICRDATVGGTDNTRR